MRYFKKRQMKKSILKVALVFFIPFFLFVCNMFFTQENMIFFPYKLDKTYKFDFNGKFEEFFIKSADSCKLNALFFKAESSKGVIFYLHGNQGSLKDWGSVAETYTKLNYDLFILDYRGFGKSEGNIANQEQLFTDNQFLYNFLKNRYSENNIIVLGYSIGTGLAAKLASENSPKLLILQAPYYNLTTEMKQRFPLIPSFILKYKFNTNEYLQKCKMPTIIFHGNNDRIINYESSLKLQKEFKKNDTLIILENQGHIGITDNVIYKSALAKILNK